MAGCWGRAAAVALVVAGVVAPTGPGGMTSGAGAAAARWRVVASRNPAPAGNALSRVSCGDAGHCVAVGPLGLVESLADGRWSVVPVGIDTGVDTHSFDIRDISCPGPSDCVAVGSDNFVPDCCDTTYRNAWATTLSGGTFTSSTDVFGFVDDRKSPYLGAVSCAPDVNHCLAVGADDGDGPYRVSKHTPGQWTTTTNPLAANLAGVSCSDASHCMAVGSAFFGAAFRQVTIAKRFVGGVGQMTLTPNRGENDALTGVSCPTPTHCFAVGWFAIGPATHTLVLEYANGRWSRRSSPSPGLESSQLSSVSCADTDHCMAVGTYGKAGVSRTLVASYEDGRWRRVPSPNRGAGANVLSGVSCAEPARCIAVGSFIAVDRSQTLIESFS